MSERNAKDYMMIFLKGIGMGSADVVPGVSGGTIAFITGIYEELLDSIKSCDKKAVELLLKRNIAELWQHINGSFLIALLSGILLSLVSFAKIITYLLAHYPIQVWSFFFGLIVISSILVLKQIKDRSIATIVSGLIGIAIAYGITSVSPSHSPENLGFVFIAGAIAICAMILPGISGSFLLLIMGKYQYIMGALKSFNLPVIIVFGLGCVVGLLSFSRLISWLLKHFHDIMVALLAGFMIGSLNKIWPWKEVLTTRVNSKGEVVPLLERNLSPSAYEAALGDPLLLQSCLYFALGIVLIAWIEGFAKWLKNKKPAG